MTLVAERPAAEVDEGALVGRRIQEFSQLAGPIREVDPGEAYRVAYRSLPNLHGRGRAVRTFAIGALNVAFEALFFLWLLTLIHRTPANGLAVAHYANWFVIGSIGIVEFTRLVNTFSFSLATVIARDPVPVAPRPDGRIAFLTTIVPTKEPIDVVRATLQAARRIRYEGVLDVWLLDEGDDPAVKAMCRELGVKHFTRKGQAEYNRRKGPFRAKTKHGNYNAWVAEHGHSYEVYLSVDPDHVPLPNYAERMLGYFRDPDVAYVVGPQCYANDDTFVTRGAESAQFAFHSLIQRAANRYNSAMLVGTNNAVRIAALVGVGGVSDSITEDLATGLKLHTRRNPESGRRWKSVYTPDVVAVGEGPSSWGDFFSQQMRWSRGTFEILLREFWTRLPRLSPGRALHYLLIINFYPSMAIAWIFGAVNALLFLALGVQGIVVPPQLWFALCVDLAAFQLWIYVRNRRYNVSPYEDEGSSGAKGMMMGVLASPIFASSLVATVLRRPARFVVTPKGASTSKDHILVFRRHLQWAGLLVAAVVAAILLGHSQPAVLLWPLVSLAICLLPPSMWAIERMVGRRPALPVESVATPDRETGVPTDRTERAALVEMIRSGVVSPDRSPLPTPAPNTDQASVAHPAAQSPAAPPRATPTPSAATPQGRRSGMAPTAWGDAPSRGRAEDGLPLGSVGTGAPRAREQSSGGRHRAPAPRPGIAAPLPGMAPGGAPHPGPRPRGPAARRGGASVPAAPPVPSPVGPPGPAAPPPARPPVPAAAPARPEPVGVGHAPVGAAPAGPDADAPTVLLPVVRVPRERATVVALAAVGRPTTASVARPKASSEDVDERARSEQAEAC